MGNNEMMLGVDGTLNIVPDHPATSATCGHRASIGISQRYLLVLGLHHQGVQTVEALNLLAQRRNLLVKPRDLGLRYRFPLAIGAVELREITGNALVNLRQPSLHLGLGEVPVPRVDGLELAAVNRNARFAEQLKASAQHHKLTADPADGLAIVLAEVGYCFEVRHQAAGQPNQLDVALALPLQAPARLYPIKVSVDVNLQQRRRMVSRPSRRLRLYAAKAQLGQIKLIDKDIDRSNRICLAQIVIQPLRKQSALTAVIANDKARHRILRPNRRRIISLKVFSHSLGLVSRSVAGPNGCAHFIGDEGRSFGLTDQVVDPKPPRAALVKSHGGERCGNVGTMIPAGTVERGERKRTVDEVSKAD